MNDAYITLIGWVATKPACRVTSSGVSVSSFRVGCTPRIFDREKELWQDMPPMFVTVNCWRQLADNVRATDMRPGEPVIVTGKLRIREYTRGEELRSSTEVEAVTVGYDMSRGTCHFQRVTRGTATAADRLELQEANDRWATPVGTTPDPDLPTSDLPTPDTPEAPTPVTSKAA